jgi:hypothetical protein
MTVPLLVAVVSFITWQMMGSAALAVEVQSKIATVPLPSGRGVVASCFNRSDRGFILPPCCAVAASVSDDETPAEVVGGRFEQADDSFRNPESISR